MPPRAVRRPSTAPALKKKAPPKTAPVDMKEEEVEEDRKHLETTERKKVVSLPSLNELPRDLSPPPKDENEYAAPLDHEIDRSERLDLDDNDPQSEPEDYAAAERNDGRGEQHEYMEDEEEDDGHDAAADLEDDEMEGEEEGDGEGDGHNGEEEEHHEIVQERRKRKEFEIFVGGLDRDATEEDLRKVFSEVGEVTEVRLMKNPSTQKNKGFAFLRFAKVEQARRALNELKHPTVNGKQCGVAPSQDSDTLFVGNICKTWTKEILKEKLVKYGVDKYEDLTLVDDMKNEGMNRGFAFIDFSSRSDALDACKRLQRRDVVFGTDRSAKVAFADTFIEPDDEIMAQVKTVFVDGLPASWDEDRVKDTLRKFGKIEKVELARNMPAAKRTDFGFITFDTHDAAVACVEGINNTELGDGDKKVKVRARLSRPRQRGRLGKYARGGYSIGHSGSRGGRSSWGLGMPHMDTWRLAGRSGRDTQDHSTYTTGLKRPLGLRDRHAVVDEVPERLGSRRRLPPVERSLGRRSPVPAYGKVSSKRDYVRHEEPFPRSSDFAARAVSGRRSSYQDAYPTRASEYLESPPRSSSRSAARRLPPYEEESYGRRMERPTSYRDGHSRDYSSISGTKRPRSAVDDDLPTRYVVSTSRQSRARYEYSGSGATLHYGESAYYGNEPTRLGRSSHIGYDGGSRSSAGHSHGMYETSTSSMGYSRGAASRGDSGGMYSSYGRDYEHGGDDLGGGGSYSSLYSSRGLSDGYLSGRGSGSYY
ncbi:uncharacterized protein LOC131234323 [Magnolia sinica]|uniref:uncharacterized protein LOC131234323 n=1 Tax=Magnolia sinica TaxID=86752 RepID=UPI00265B0706|nr:uncharacterized protein LOC131234323 [Magnolia sinica]